MTLPKEEVLAVLDCMIAKVSTTAADAAPKGE